MRKVLVLASTLVLPACVVDPYYPSYGYTNVAAPALVGAAAGAAVGYGLGQAYAPAYYQRPYYYRPHPYYYRRW